ncbi:glutamyl-tRNA synthetase [Aulographum hederae CBS 113979]|uniref:Glutamyl-tRNA synthetase n=1 Tax=Aulographum hederae CBS 113979 TaxID=1176131 RepID=A0A6G1HCS1_9PEZI|nr:glutamyl-tRNA synthetase [Aulographum hederae CBS 113979]
MATPYEKALSSIDAAHSQDPKIITIKDGSQIPYELHYAQCCSKWLSQRAPSASEPLSLAIRAQHFRRFEIPRSDYPDGKAGYLNWRTFLKKRQAEQTAQVCLDSGYSTEDAARVGALIRKEGLKNDEETQILEDVACLVFLEDQFEEFEKGHDEEKIIGILRKTWGKMSEKGRELALTIAMDGRPKELVEKALSG